MTKCDLLIIFDYLRFQIKGFKDFDDHIYRSEEKKYIGSNKINN